jgi:low affinity Fe/Cu permease
MSRVINAVASFLSTAHGFVVTFLALMVGVGIGAVLQFHETFMFGFNIFLSVAAIVISGIILVSAARSEAALHVKLDHLIDCSRAPEKTIGLEHKEVTEIEEERKAIEETAERKLEAMVEMEVEDEVAERLSERSSRVPSGS